MNRFLILIFLFSIYSCTSKKDSQEKINSNFFNSIELGERNKNLRFFITAFFDECGEWGGHNEILEFFGKDNNTYLNYRKSKVDCNRISDLYGQPEFNQWIINDTIKLSKKHKIAINKYLKSLIDSKLNEGLYAGHSGRSFKAFKTDSTFLIKIFSNDDYKINTHNYNQLLQAFKLDTVQ